MFPNEYKIVSDSETLPTLVWDVYHKEHGKYKYVQTFETSEEAVKFVENQEKKNNLNFFGKSRIIYSGKSVNNIVQED